LLMKYTSPGCSVNCSISSGLLELAERGHRPLSPLAARRGSRGDESVKPKSGTFNGQLH
jgi:hypothetical protein